MKFTSAIVLTLVGFAVAHHDGDGGESHTHGSSLDTRHHDGDSGETHTHASSLDTRHHDGDSDETHTHGSSLDTRHHDGDSNETHTHGSSLDTRHHDGDSDETHTHGSSLATRHHDGDGGESHANSADGHDGHDGHDHGNNGTSLKAQCKKLSKLTKLTDLAANATRLAEKADNNATLIAEVQAKAEAAKTTLSTLQANATLVESCNVIFAENDMEDACDDLWKLEQATKVVGNATLLAKWTEDNATLADEFKAKVESKQADLTALQGNETLTTFCAARTVKHECKSIAKFAKWQALAANETALNEAFSEAENPTEKIEKFKAKLAESTPKFNELTANATLTAACQDLGITVAATTGNAQSATSAEGDKGSATETTSAAGSVGVRAGGQVFALVSAFVFALAML